MFGWLARRRRQREVTIRKAEKLIAACGADAWAQSYARSRDRSLSAEDRDAAYRVRREIERRLKIAPRTDTATRYLEE